MNRKLIFASVIFLLCAFLHISVSAAEQYPTKEEQGCLAKAFLKAVNVLPDSEEFNDNNDPDKNITRSELAECIVRAMGEREESAYIPMFTDVSEKHPGAGYIAAAVRMQLMRGYDNGTFLPDYPVRYEEAVKVCITALGYGRRAELRGGFPFGYTDEANRLSVLKNVSGETGTFITAGNFYIMIKNMLSAPMLEIIEVSGTDALLENSAGKTILDTYLGISSDLGKVSCTERSALTEPSSLGEGRAVIGDRTYRSKNSNVNDYLGHIVTAYYKNDNELLFVWPEKYSEIVVNAKNIETDSSDFSAACFVYRDENGRVQRADISPYADLIYNGVSVGGYSAEDLKIARGYIRLTDNDRDGLFDIISVYSYYDMVVGNINSSDFFIQDAENTAVFVKLNPEDSDKYLFEIEKDGAEYAFSMLEKGDVLSVFESRNTRGKMFKKIIVSKNSAVGTMTSKVSESGKPSGIVIDGEYYTTSEYFDENYSSLPIKTKGRFLLNFDGEITAPAIAVKRSFNYGYIINADITEKLAARAQFKLISENGEILTLTASDRINVDGKIYRGHTEQSELLKSDLIRQSDGSCRQLVRYKMDESEQLRELDTVASGAADTDELKNDFAAETRYYIASAFGNEKFDFMADSGTAIFIVPKTSKDDEEQYFAMIGINSFFLAGNTYSAAAYDTDDTLTAGAIVIETDMPKTNGNAKRTMIIDKISFITDDIVKVTGFQSGSYVTFSVDDGTELSQRVKGFKRGDLILPVANAKGELVYARKLFTPTLDLRIDNYNKNDVTAFDPDDSTITFGDGDNVIFLGSNADNMQDQFRGQYSALLRKNGSKIVLSGVDLYSGEPVTDDIASMFPLTVPSNATVVICKFGEKSVAKGTLNDLDKYIYASNPDARVFVHTYNGDVKDIFLFDFSD